MVKYLNAEIYKLTHRKTYLFGFFAFILGGVTAFMVLCKYNAGNGASLNFFLMNLPPLFMTGMFLVLMVSDMVFSDQYKFNTLKNEASYGLPRTRIYLGKLIATALAAVVICAIIILFYAVLAAILFPVEDGMGEVLTHLGQTLALSLPLWFGGLGFGYMLLFVMKGSTSATMVYVLVLGMGDTILDLLEMIQPRLSEVLETVRSWLLMTPFNQMDVSSAAIGHAWLVGMSWLVVSTLVGVVVFQKREIN